MSPVRVSRVTPGVSSAKSMKLRPLTGRLCTAVSSTVALTWERLVSMIGVAPLTVIDSATPLTPISMRSVTVWPIVSLISSCFWVRNPASSAVRLYTPTGSSGAENRPFASVTATRCAPLSASVSVTVTPGRSAPD